MFSGSTRPGKSTVPSGNNGIVVLILATLRHAPSGAPCPRTNTQATLGVLRAFPQATSATTSRARAEDQLELCEFGVGRVDRTKNYNAREPDPERRLVMEWTAGL